MMQISARNRIEKKQGDEIGNYAENVLISEGWLEAPPVLTACQPREKGVLAWMV